MPHKDPEARKAYNAEYHKKNRVKHNNLKKKIRYKNKTKAMEYLGGKCAISSCNHNATEPHHFDLHHTNGKNYNFSGLMNSPWKKIKKEIDDCEAVLLCAMCHRDITYE